MLSTSNKPKNLQIKRVVRRNTESRKMLAIKIRNSHNKKTTEAENLLITKRYKSKPKERRRTEQPETMITNMKEGTTTSMLLKRATSLQIRKKKKMNQLMVQKRKVKEIIRRTSSINRDRLIHLI